MQNKTKMKYIIQCPRKLKLDRYFIIGVGEDMEQEKLTHRWDANWFNHIGKLPHFMLTLNTHIHYDLAISLLLILAEQKCEYVSTS